MEHAPLPPLPEHLLRRWRKAKGFTIEHCARSVGTTGPVWHAWETRKRRPGPKFMPRVREFTRDQVTADDFFPSIERAA